MIRKWDFSKFIGKNYNNYFFVVTRPAFALFAYNFRQAFVSSSWRLQGW